MLRSRYLEKCIILGKVEEKRRQLGARWIAIVALKQLFWTMNVGG